MSKLLEVTNLNVDIPLAAGMLHAVREVSFSVEQGHTTALVGESGCGKSLTALAIMDLLPKRARRSTEQLHLAGQDLSTAGERRMANIRGNQMAMIFQEPMTSLNPCYTIGNQLTEALLRHRSVPHSEARDRAVFLLEKVGITAAASRLKQYPHQLSGGLRQRVMIAMRSGIDYCGRTHHGSGRHHPGPNSGAAGRIAKRVRYGDDHDHP
jgi:peptide/nickel transport system ATP-binding protein